MTVQRIIKFVERDYQVILIIFVVMIHVE